MCQDFWTWVCQAELQLHYLCVSKGGDSCCACFSGNLDSEKTLTMWNRPTSPARMFPFPHPLPAMCSRLHSFVHILPTAWSAFLKKYYIRPTLYVHLSITTHIYKFWHLLILGNVFQGAKVWHLLTFTSSWIKVVERVHSDRLLIFPRWFMSSSPWWCPP